MESKAKKELIRIAGYEGVITVDLSGKAKGRGVYVCPAESCFAKAIKKKAIGRGLSIEMTKLRTEELLEELRAHAGKEENFAEIVSKEINNNQSDDRGVLVCQ